MNINLNFIVRETTGHKMSTVMGICNVIKGKSSIIYWWLFHWSSLVLYFTECY